MLLVITRHCCRLLVIVRDSRRVTSRYVDAAHVHTRHHVDGAQLMSSRRGYADMRGAIMLCAFMPTRYDESCHMLYACPEYDGE